MDSLDDLPPTNTQQTPAEQAVMQRFFTKQASDTAKGVGGTLKGATWFTLVFAVLAHPWVDASFDRIPYCDNPMFKFALKVALFFVLAACLVKWGV